MKQSSTCILILLTIFFGGCGDDDSSSSVVSTPEVVYSNDFNQPDSLNNLIIGEIGTAKVITDQNQLRINPGFGYLNRGFIVINLADISSFYKYRLAENTGIVTWSFNVSNVDGDFNNLFQVSIFSKPDPSDAQGFGYVFTGGGYVQNRFILSRQALAFSPFGPVDVPLVDEVNGLGTLPMRGAIKITYNPANHEWHLYFEQASEYPNPTRISTLIGKAVDATFTTESLPYLIFTSEYTGSAFFDNITVSIQ